MIVNKRISITYANAIHLSLLNSQSSQFHRIFSYYNRIRIQNGYTKTVWTLNLILKTLNNSRNKADFKCETILNPSSLDITNFVEASSGNIFSFSSSFALVLHSFRIIGKLKKQDQKSTRCDYQKFLQLISLFSQPNC